MELRFQLGPQRESVTAARRLVSEALAGLSDDATRSDIELVVAELVANAVEHARTTCDVRVRVMGDAVRIEVADESEEAPAPAEPTPTSERGRGLLVIDAISGRWGVDHHETGKTVWCEVPLQPPTGSDAD